MSLEVLLGTTSVFNLKGGISTKNVKFKLRFDDENKLLVFIEYLRNSVCMITFGNTK